FSRDWSSDVCSSDLAAPLRSARQAGRQRRGPGSASQSRRHSRAGHPRAGPSTRPEPSSVTTCVSMWSKRDTGCHRGTNRHSAPPRRKDPIVSSTEVAAEQRRGAFSSRKVFIFAAIGSAVGLGNIWRFPYVAYENGGGAFILPCLTPVLPAGIPCLLLDYAIGHRSRGPAPLAFARLNRKTEALGWWQVAICVIISIYYAAILAWAVRYTLFSADKEWGGKPGEFFEGSFLKITGPDEGVSFEFVAGLLIPLLLVWVVTIAIMALGVQKGVGATSVIFIPALVIAFLALVVRALFLPGAADGLDALFTPNWDALTDAGV